MFTTELIADETKPRDEHGNLMTLVAELVEHPDAPPQIGVTLTINTGHPAHTHTDEQGGVTVHEEELDTELYFQMPFEKSEGFSNGLKKLMDDYHQEQVVMLRQALEFKSAQLACAKGNVGQITITKLADVDRGTAVGFMLLDLEYFDDSPEPVLIHSVSAIECYVPFMQDEQYEWLRTLVGGNHQYTTNIKVQLVGFTLEEVRLRFEESLRRGVTA